MTAFKRLAIALIAVLMTTVSAQAFTALMLPLSALVASTAQASASESDGAGLDKETDIRAAFSDMDIKEIHKTGIKGLYEIQAAGNIYYVDGKGEYLISGHMFKSATKEDITAKRLAEINRINWNELPLKDAIVNGPKNGIKMAVFTDPDCPYCKRLEEHLQSLEGIRVYTFLFPLSQLHPDAYAKSEAIWCAKDKHRALVDTMLKGKVPPKAKSTCKTPIDKNIKLARVLGVNGTPTIFAEDGRKYTGGDLLVWLKQK